MLNKIIVTAALLASAAFVVPATAAEPQDFSPAEKLLFMTRQLDGLKLPASLRYSFRQTGTEETPFDDQVMVQVTALSQGGCCKASGDFLSGANKLALPEIEGAEGNPVVLYFLENDIRTMKRLTKGSQGYFRKRIRLALVDAATVRPVRVAYKGTDIDAQEIQVAPYRDDPNRARFEKYIGKQYRFILSPAVPGGVWGIQSVVAPSAPGAPLIQQELLIEGASAFPARAPS